MKEPQKHGRPVRVDTAKLDPHAVISVEHSSPRTSNEDTDPGHEEDENKD
jgi:hypothetical protein